MPCMILIGSVEPAALLLIQHRRAQSSPACGCVAPEAERLAVQCRQTPCWTHSWPNPSFCWSPARGNHCRVRSSQYNMLFGPASGCPRTRPDMPAWQRWPRAQPVARCAPVGELARLVGQQLRQAARLGRAGCRQVCQTREQAGRADVQGQQVRVWLPLGQACAAGRRAELRCIPQSEGAWQASA